MTHDIDPKLREDVAQLYARMCSAMADPTRILIIYTLSEGSHNVSDLAGMLGMSQPTVSRHLKVLRDRNLVVAHRDGQSVYYSLADRRVVGAMDILRTVMADMLKNQAALARDASDHLVVVQE